MNSRDRQHARKRDTLLLLLLLAVIAAYAIALVLKWTSIL